MAEANCQAVPELVVITEVDIGSALKAIDYAGLRTKVHGSMVHDGVAVVGSFEPGCRRQRIVRQCGGRGHEVVVDHEQVKVLERLNHQLGIGERDDGIVCLDNERLDGIRIARDHLAEHQRRI